MSVAILCVQYTSTTVGSIKKKNIKVPAKEYHAQKVAECVTKPP